MVLVNLALSVAKLLPLNRTSWAPRLARNSPSRKVRSQFTSPAEPNHLSAMGSYAPLALVMRMLSFLAKQTKSPSKH